MPKPSIGWPYRPSYGQYLPIAFQHDECCILIRQPAERGQGNASI
jgi:hypothetical protein